LYLQYNKTIKTTHAQIIERTVTGLSKERAQQKTWNIVQDFWTILKDYGKI